MKSRFLVTSGAALALTMMFAGCSVPGQTDSDSSGQPTDERLTVAVYADPVSMDPATFGIEAGSVAYLFGQTLTSQYNPEGVVEPGLATEWEGSEDAKTWTFKLRDDVVFSDGTKMNADTVVQSFERMLDEQFNSPVISDLRLIESVKADDEYTVTFQLKAGLGYFPAALSEFVAIIVSPTTFDAEGNTYERVEKPITTGPYVVESYDSGQSVVLTRNDEYWGEAPAYESIEFRIVPEAAARESMLRSGEVDVTERPPVTSIEALEASPDVNVEISPSNLFQFLGVNQMRADNPLLQDVRVREALNLAIDREAIINSVRGGIGTPATAPASVQAPGACTVGSIEYDPDKARDLLKEAGAENLNIVLQAPTGRYLQDFPAAGAVANYLREVGIEVEGPVTKDSAAYVADLRTDPSQTSFDMAMMQSSAPVPTAIRTLSFFPTNRIAPAGLNFMGYSNAEFDTLLGEATLETDEAKQSELICEATTLLWNDFPAIWLWEDDSVLLTNDTVEEVSILPRGILYLENAHPVN